MIHFKINYILWLLLVILAFSGIVPFSLIPALLYLIFATFEEIQCEYMRLTLKASPLEQAPIDEKLWIGPTFTSMSVRLAMLAMRPMRWAFLIYLGYKTVWYYPLALYAISIYIAAFSAVYLRLHLGARDPSLIGFVLMPFICVFMWILV